MELTNWGRYPSIETTLHACRSEGDLRAILSDDKKIIPRGLGRCYGDSALNSDILSTLHLNCFRAFDEGTGELTCEGGVTLEDILYLFVPRGWFLPVTPGTRFITVGGAVASDVHGKNHHAAGALSRHIRGLKVMLASGETIFCSRDENEEFFHATCGGMGLTGIILEATFRLIRIPTAFIRQETVRAADLDEIMNLFETSSDWTYSVAWIDCMARGGRRGRSILMRGEHARMEELPGRKIAEARMYGKNSHMTVPCDFPSLSLNRFSVRAFNEIYYRKTRHGISRSITGLDAFFYPLDGILQWNRIYGKRGFTQYQFVLPKESSREGLDTILGVIAEFGQGSFLAVLKLFGKQEGLLNFPREGYTLALDFPIRDGLFEVLDRLDAVVLDYGGRHYLTKDARMAKETFHKGYPNAGRFAEIKKRYDPDGKFQSLQSRRLGI